MKIVIDTGQDGTIINARVRQKAATEAEWLSKDPEILDGEAAFVRRADGAPVNFKLGDGNKKFSELPYFVTGDAGEYINVMGSELPVSGPNFPDKGYAVVGPGTYTQSGGPDVVVPSGHMGILNWDGSVWYLGSSVEMPTQSADGEIEEGDDRAVSGDTASSFFEKNVGIYSRESNGTNPLDALKGTDRGDENVWGQGFFRVDGSINDGPNSTAWLYNKDFIPIEKGRYSTDLWLLGNYVHLVVYDSDKNVVSSITGSTGTVENTGELIFEVAEDGFYRTSYPKAGDSNPSVPSLEDRHITSLPYTEVTNDVFVKSSDLEKNVIDITNNSLGVVKIPSNTNFIEELTTSSVDDLNLWGKGFLMDDGSVSPPLDRWFHTLKYYQLPIGIYEYKMFFSGDAKGILYDLGKNITQVLSNSGTDEHSGTLNITEPTLIRFSFRKALDETVNRLVDLSIKNTTDVNPIFITNENIDEFIDDTDSSFRVYFHNKFRPKRKIPIVSIISDDGHVRNDEWFIPKLDSHGVKATFAIIGQNTVDADSGASNGYFTSERLIELTKDGHELASHTWTHTNNITTQDPDVVDWELARNKVFVESLTHTPCDMFVSPFGARNAETDNIIARYYKANFISGYGVRNELPLDNLFINRVSFDGSDTSYTLLWEDRLKPAIDSAIANNEWVVFTVHPQYSQYRDSNNPNAEDRRNEMDLLINYCKDNDIQIMTAGDAYGYFKNHVDIGVKRYDTRYYKLAMDMTEENAGYFDE